jgi:hypothetical protein
MPSSISGAVDLPHERVPGRLFRFFRIRARLVYEEGQS